MKKRIEIREIIESIYRGAAEAESENALVCETYGFDRAKLYIEVAACIAKFYGIPLNKSRSQQIEGFKNAISQIFSHTNGDSHGCENTH